MTKTRKIAQIPDEILQKLVFFCEANNIGFAQIGNPELGLMMYIFGSQTMSPDQAAIVGADILLQGVIHGFFHDVNEEALNQRNSEPPPKPN